jgi:tRNA(fMet)-specific endonuclease VapC
MNNPEGKVAQRLIELEDNAAFTSIIVAGELHFGILNKGSKRLARNLDRILVKLEVVPFTQPAEKLYAEVRLVLERKGKPIGQNDTLIAAHALALDAIVVTDNVRHFSEVPGLMVENWLR